LWQNWTLWNYFVWVLKTYILSILLETRNLHRSVWCDVFKTEFQPFLDKCSQTQGGTAFKLKKNPVASWQLPAGMTGSIIPHNLYSYTSKFGFWPIFISLNTIYRILHVHVCKINIVGRVTNTKCGRNFHWVQRVHLRFT
jgi:hypothetical protein